ncbi:MAG TPA: hypothetical protein VLB73_02515 [Patescibacteria group bacterium]|nr:hypothetical protein [Patescibacteria group bacterium]
MFRRKEDKLAEKTVGVIVVAKHEDDAREQVRRRGAQPDSAIYGGRVQSAQHRNGWRGRFGFPLRGSTPHRPPDGGGGGGNGGIPMAA